MPYNRTFIANQYLPGLLLLADRLARGSLLLVLRCCQFFIKCIPLFEQKLNQCQLITLLEHFLSQSIGCDIIHIQTYILFLDIEVVLKKGIGVHLRQFFFCSFLHSSVIRLFKDCFKNVYKVESIPPALIVYCYILGSRIPVILRVFHTDIASIKRDRIYSSYAIYICYNVSCKFVRSYDDLVQFIYRLS